MLPNRHVVALAAALSLAAPHRTVAQTTPATIDACFVPASGTIYRVDTPASPAPGAPKQCLSATHRQFTWNQQGVPGPQGLPGQPGPAGPSGARGPEGAGIRRASFNVRRFPFTIPRSVGQNFTFLCNPGEVMLGAVFTPAEVADVTALIDVKIAGAIFHGNGPGQSGPPTSVGVSVVNNSPFSRQLIASLSCYLPPA